MLLPMAKRVATFVVIVGVGAAAVDYIGNELGPGPGILLGVVVLVLLVFARLVRQSEP
jgi:hypothetical protein